MTDQMSISFPYKLDIVSCEGAGAGREGSAIANAILNRIPLYLILLLGIAFLGLPEPGGEGEEGGELPLPEHIQMVWTQRDGPAIHLCRRGHPKLVRNGENSQVCHSPPLTGCPALQRMDVLHSDNTK